MEKEYKCAALYTQANIRSNNVVYPCCRFKKPIGVTDGNLKNILNSKMYVEARKKFEKDKGLIECSRCLHEEKIGIRSYRQYFNEKYSTKETKLIHLVVNLNNICNLICESCNSEFSSSWGYKEKLLKHEIYKFADIKSIPDSVEVIEFQGGEPLMTNQHRTLLEMHPSPSICNLLYFTNSTFSLSDKDHKIFKKFKNIEFHLSIDGYAEINNKVRIGSNWNMVEKNAIEIGKSYNCVVETVFHKNTALHLKSLENWIKQNNFKWRIHPVTRPRHLDVTHTLCSNENDKKKLLSVIDSLDYHKKDELYNHCSSKYQAEWIK